MATKKAVKKITLTHIYDHYPLYKLIYGQPVPDRTRDVQEAVILTDVWLENKNLGGHLVQDKRQGKIAPLTVLEMFSGSSSEHELEFRRQCHFPIHEYGLTDVVLHPDSDQRMLIADLTADPTPKEILDRQADYAVLLAFYYSGGSFLKESTIHDPTAALNRLMKNAATLCMYGGLFVLDIPENPYRGLYENLIADDTDGDTVRELPIYSFNPLRASLGLPVVGGVCTLKYRLTNRVSRTRSLCIDTLDDIHVTYNEKVVAEFKIKEPFIQVMFTEAEYCRAASNAGFKDFIFLGYSEDGGYEVNVDEWLDPVGKEDSIPDSMFATKIGFVRG